MKTRYQAVIPGFRWGALNQTPLGRIRLITREYCRKFSELSIHTAPRTAGAGKRERLPSRRAATRAPPHATVKHSKLEVLLMYVCVHSSGFRVIRLGNSNFAHRFLILYPIQRTLCHSVSPVKARIKPKISYVIENFEILSDKQYCSRSMLNPWYPKFWIFCLRFMVFAAYIFVAPEPPWARTSSHRFFLVRWRNYSEFSMLLALEQIGRTRRAVSRP